MPRPTSDIWQYFTTIPTDTKVKKSKCSFCDHEQSSGITRLAHHLFEKCQAIPVNIREELRSKAESKAKPTPYIIHDTSGAEDAFTILAARSTHQNLTSPSTSELHHFSVTGPSASPVQYNLQTQSTNPGQMAMSAPLDPSEQSALDRHLARAFYAANISFAAIEHPLMMDFFRQLRPGYQVPRKRRLEQSLLKTEHWDLIGYEVQKPDTTTNDLRKNGVAVTGSISDNSTGNSSDEVDGGVL